MKRRGFLTGSVALACLSTGALADAEPARWIRPTEFIDADDPSIVALSQSLAPASLSDREKALKIFVFVRDEIAFGFAAGFWRQKASEVLTLRRGYCNTKSTLFVALLRAAGVPARQVFVEIDSAVLHGLIDPGTPMLDHSFTEVHLNGAWRATDAYIVDPPLFRPAQALVQREDRFFGYGVQAFGTTRWDGRTDSFAQYNRNDPNFVAGRVWGVFEDVGAFYAEAQEPWNRLNGLLRASFGIFAAGANERADRLRAAG